VEHFAPPVRARSRDGWVRRDGDDLQHRRKAALVAALASMVGFLAEMASFGGLFGAGHDEDRNPLQLLLIALLGPIAPGIVQLAVTGSGSTCGDILDPSADRRPPRAAGGDGRITR
jgi:hypothetical protein